MNYNQLKLPAGLHVRPAVAKDKVFLAQLHNEKRDDLRLIQGEKDFVESIIAMQLNAMDQGYGEQFPNALYFIIEYYNEAVGRAVLDFEHNRVHLIDIAFLHKARRHGLGEAVLRSFMYSASQLKVPMLLSVQQLNVAAKRLYSKLGFKTVEITAPYERMMWYPQAIVYSQAFT